MAAYRLVALDSKAPTIREFLNPGAYFFLGRITNDENCNFG